MKRGLSVGWKTTEAAEFPTQPRCQLSQGRSNGAKPRQGEHRAAPALPEHVALILNPGIGNSTSSEKKNRIRIFHKCPRGHESRIRKFHSAEILKLPQPFRQLQNSSCGHVPGAGAGGGHTPCWGMHHSAPRPVPLAPVEMVLLCYLLPSAREKGAKVLCA